MASNRPCESVERSAAINRLVSCRYFDAFPVAQDPRLWYEDRLHGNTLGHIKVAEALAWRLGISGFDQTWAELMEEERPPRRPREQITGDVDWAVHYLMPWLGKGVRRIPHGLGIQRKRPIPTIMPKTAARVD